MPLFNDNINQTRQLVMSTLHINIIGSINIKSAIGTDEIHYKIHAKW